MWQIAWLFIGQLLGGGFVCFGNDKEYNKTDKELVSNCCLCIMQ